MPSRICLTPTNTGSNCAVRSIILPFATKREALGAANPCLSWTRHYGSWLLGQRHRRALPAVACMYSYFAVSVCRRGWRVGSIAVLTGAILASVPFRRYATPWRWGSRASDMGMQATRVIRPSCAWAVSLSAYSEGLRGVAIRDPADSGRHDPAAELLKYPKRRDRNKTGQRQDKRPLI